MKYVSIYGNAMSTVLPSPANYCRDITLRYPIFVPFTGTKYQIRLDNFCANEDVTINKVTVSKGLSLSDVCNSGFTTLTNNKKEEFHIKAHDNILSDEFYIDVKPNEYLIVSLYIKDYTLLTSGVDIKGPYSKGYFGLGDQSENTKLDINLSKSTSWFYFLSDIYAYTNDTNEAVICYGDSITSQDWPDYLSKSLRDNNINNVSVIRKAVSGTRILREYNCITYQSYGLKGEKRFNHEISCVRGAKKLIIQQGINDIIHPVGEEINIFRPMSDMPTLEDLKNGIDYYLNEAKKYNLDCYIGTLLPIYNWRTYASFREEIKNSFNEYIKSIKHIDFGEVVGTLDDNKWKFKDGFDSGDHLHPSSKAYEEMGKEASKIITF